MPAVTAPPINPSATIILTGMVLVQRGNMLRMLGEGVKRTYEIRMCEKL